MREKERKIILFKTRKHKVKRVFKDFTDYWHLSVQGLYGLLAIKCTRTLRTIGIEVYKDFTEYGLIRV